MALLRRLMSIKLIELYAAVENPTADQIKRLTRGVKEKIAEMSAYLNCNKYKPENDDKGNEVPIGKRVRELEVKHRRTQKRLKTVEMKQAIVDSKAIEDGVKEIATVDKKQQTLKSFFKKNTIP